MTVDLSRIKSAFMAFAKHRVAVLGDLMLDSFVIGDVDRISPEAPVPVLVKQRQEYYAGGSANVATNIVELGAQATAIGVAGEDEAGFELVRLLDRKGIDTSFILKSASATTTIKTRYVSMGHQLLRVDEERYLHWPDIGASPNISALEDCTVLLVSDYNKGVIPLWAADYISRAIEKGMPVVVDPKPPNWKYYAGCDVVTPNKKESLSIITQAANPANNTDYDSEAMRVEIAHAVCGESGAKNAVMTLGADGMLAWDGNRLETIPSHRVQVFDPTGAGDSVIAAIALSKAAGLTLFEAAHVANAAGAVAVSRPGIARVSRTDILRVLDSDIR